MEDTILINSNFKRKYDEAFENAFIFPTREAHIVENKFILIDENNQPNIEQETPQIETEVIATETIDVDLENDYKNSNDQEPISIFNSNEIQPVDENNNVENLPQPDSFQPSNTLSLTPDSTTESVKLNLETTNLEFNESQAKNDDQIDSIESQHFNSINDLFDDNKIKESFIKENINSLEDLRKETNKSLSNDIKMKELDIPNCTEFNDIIESPYCFELDKFYDALFEYSSPLNTRSKILAFKFVSLTCSQLVELIFDNIPYFNEFSKEWRILLIKILTNLLYDYFELKLIQCLEDPTSKMKKYIKLSASIFDFIRLSFRDRKLISEKRILKKEETKLEEKVEIVPIIPVKEIPLPNYAESSFNRRSNNNRKSVVNFNLD